MHTQPTNALFRPNLDTSLGLGHGLSAPCRCAARGAAFRGAVSCQMCVGHRCISCWGCTHSDLSASTACTCHHMHCVSRLTGLGGSQATSMGICGCFAHNLRRPVTHLGGPFRTRLSAQRPHNSPVALFHSAGAPSNGRKQDGHACARQPCTFVNFTLQHFRRPVQTRCRSGAWPDVSFEHVETLRFCCAFSTHKKYARICCYASSASCL